MPAIPTDPMAKGASASGVDPGPSALTHPDVLLGISVGCASLTAVIASIIVWRYLKRRCKGREEMSGPGLVLDGNIIEENEPHCTLNLDLEKDAPDLPHITDIPPEFLFTPTIEDIFVSDSDSDSNVSKAAEDDPELDDWDFKCCGQPLEFVDEDCNDPYSSQERAFAENIQGTLTLASPPATTPFEEEEFDRLASQRALGNLWTIAEEEGNESSEDQANENLSMCMYESTDIAQEDVIEKAHEEGLVNEDATVDVLNDDAKPASAAIDEYPYATKDLISCDSLQTKAIRIDIENVDLLLIENDSEDEAATGSGIQDVTLRTFTNEVGSAVTLIAPDSSSAEEAVKKGSSYHFSEADPIQYFVKNVDELKGEDLCTKLMKEDDSTMAPNPVWLDIPTSSRSQALQAVEIHEPDTTPIHYRPSASSDLDSSESGMPTVASVKGKDDGAQLSDFLFNEKCIKKSRRKAAIKTGVSFLEGEKEELQSVNFHLPDHSEASQLSAEIDQKHDICARDIEKREETDALRTSDQVNYHDIVRPVCLSIVSDSALQSTKISIPLRTASSASPNISDPIKLDSALPADGSSHNGQCSPPWWEVLEKIKQDPLGCNGVEMFREWAIKNGIASEHVKQRSKAKPSAKQTKPAPPPVKVAVRKAAIPVSKDREVIKRDLEKMFREWWATGNETILGPAADRSFMRSDQVDDTISKLSQSLPSNQDQCSPVYFAQDKVNGVLANEEMDHSISSSNGTLRNFTSSSVTSSKELSMTKLPLEDRCRGNQLDEKTNHEPENSDSSQVPAHILRRSPTSPTKRIHEAPIAPRNLAGAKSGMNTVTRTPVQRTQQNMVSSHGSLRRATLPSEAASTHISKGPKTIRSSLRGSPTPSNQSRTAAITSPPKLPVISAKSRLTTLHLGKSTRIPPSATADRFSSVTTAKVDSRISSSPQRRSLSSPAKPAWNSSVSKSSGASIHVERTQRKMESKRSIDPANRAQTLRRDTLPQMKPVVNGDTRTNKENNKPSQYKPSNVAVNGNPLRRTISSDLSIASRNGSQSCVGAKGSSIRVRA